MTLEGKHRVQHTGKISPMTLSNVQLRNVKKSNVTLIPILLKDPMTLLGCTSK